MLRGHIDSVTTSGLVEGWALDYTNLLTPVAVAILTPEGGEIASGVADLFREDLACAGIGFGWCAFRLALTAAPEAACNRLLRLVEAKDGNTIFKVAAPLREDVPYEVTDLNELLAGDPTVLRSAEQLESLSPILDAFVAARGIEAFVGASYLYVLGRCVDPSGLESFGRQLRTRRLTPYALLLVLAESAEFRQRGRALSAPNRPGFPFLIF